MDLDYELIFTLNNIYINLYRLLSAVKFTFGTHFLFYTNKINVRVRLWSLHNLSQFVVRLVNSYEHYLKLTFNTSNFMGLSQ